MSEGPEGKPEDKEPNQPNQPSEPEQGQPSQPGETGQPEGGQPEQVEGGEQPEQPGGVEGGEGQPSQPESRGLGLRVFLARIEDALRRGYTIPLVTFSKSKGVGAFFLRTPDNKRTRICTTRDEECEDALRALPSIMSKLGLTPDFSVDDLVMQLKGLGSGERRRSSASGVLSDEGVLLESIGPAGRASGFIAELRELLRRRFEFLRKIDEKLTMYTWASTWLALASSNVPPEDLVKLVSSDSGAVYDVALKTITEALSTYRNYKDELQRLKEENEKLKLQVVYWRTKYEMLEDLTSEPNRLERLIETLIATRPDLDVEVITNIIERFLSLIMTQPQLPSLEKTET
jgi:hypothetical protein